MTMYNNNKLSGRQQFFQRQKSVFREMYTMCKWCAVYADTGGNNNNNSSDNFDSLLQEIPKTDPWISLSTEESIMEEILDSQDTEKKRKQTISSSFKSRELQLKLQKEDKEERDRKRKQEEQQIYNRKSNEKDDKVNQLIALNSSLNRDQALHFLNKYNWDMEKAAEASWTSLSLGNLGTIGQGNKNELGFNNNNFNSGLMNLNTSVLLISLPDNRSFTFNMKADDTFWGVYGKLLQSASDLANKPFNFIIPNGDKLTENSFDKTLSDTGCVPQGNIRVVY